MKIFTIRDNKVLRGASLETYSEKGNGISFPAIIVGRQGGECEPKVLPVQLTEGQLSSWNQTRSGTIEYAEIGRTRKGKPKLKSLEVDEEDNRAIFVFITSVTKEGLSEYTGDYDPEKSEFLSFPGEVISSGYISQGDMGRFGNSDQMVAIIPQNAVFHTAYKGKRYGQALSYFYKWDGEQVLACTEEELEVSGLF